MADWLRSLDNDTRVFLTIFLVAALHGFASVQWQRYKLRQAKNPITMKLKGDTYVPWGTVERIESAGMILVRVWAIWMAVMIAALIYVKWNGIRF